MDRYVETKTEKDKQIKKLEAELASHRADGSSPSSPPPTSDHTPSTSKADTTKPTSDEADPGSWKQLFHRPEVFWLDCRIGLFRIRFWQSGMSTSQPTVLHHPHSATSASYPDPLGNPALVTSPLSANLSATFTLWVFLHQQTILAFCMICVSNCVFIILFRLSSNFWREGKECWSEMEEDFRISDRPFQYPPQSQRQFDQTPARLNSLNDLTSQTTLGRSSGRRLKIQRGERHGAGRLRDKMKLDTFTMLTLF